MIKYVNHNGAEYTLEGAGHTFVDAEASSLRAYLWSFSTTNRPSGFGGSASGFARYPVTRELTVGIRGATAAEFNQRANTLLAVCEADVMTGEPGRLYIGTQYIVCYLAVGSTVDVYSRKLSFVRKRLTVLIVEPYWCSEDTTVFNILQDEPDTTGKKFNLRYAYRYGSGYSVTNLYNNHYAACPAVISVYGACENPSIQIGGNTYNVDVQIAATERLVIDQIKRRIFIVASNGAQTNAFNNRNKAHDVFALIPVGASQVLYSGEFKFAVTLIRQRSEPEWT